MALLHTCLERCGAIRGQVYLLDLAVGALMPYVSEPEGSVVPDPVIRPDRISASRLTVLREIPSTGQANAGVDGVTGIVAYAYRGETCVGAIRLDGLDAAIVGAEMRDDLLALSGMLVSVYESRFVLNLLTTISTPPSFSASESEFFHAIGAHMKASSGMEFVGLRELVDGKLRCVALAGFGENPAIRGWDLDDPYQYRPFARSLSGGGVAVQVLDEPTSVMLHTPSWGEDVRSLVTAPIFVGGEVFGVVSFGCRCEFEYAPAELRGFESIANGAGVLITNFRNSRRIAAEISTYTEVATAVTAMEVARAARHEALNYIGVCQMALRNLWARVGKPDGDNDIESMDTALRRLGAALDNLRMFPQTYGVREEMSLKQVCHEAVTTIVGRLEQERVDVRIGTPLDAQVYGSPARLRQVFLNLLLNSADAFGDGRKSGRRIDITITPGTRRSGETVVTYHDNATGINPASLHGIELHHDLPVQQQIFQAGVTSKHDGSGFGLWLVRQVLHEHQASIDLVDYRRGVTFVLRFPTPAEAKLRMQEVI
jgi:signal transduction histidine kinase